MKFFFFIIFFLNTYILRVIYKQYGYLKIFIIDTFSIKCCKKNFFKYNMY